MEPGNEAGTALALEGVEKRFAGGLLRPATTVLRGVTLTLERGACAGLVGPNGSGKSTLLRIAAGVERPDAGCVRVLGAPLDDAEARGRIGFLPDGAPFPPELSARAVLELLASLHGLPRGARRARCDALLARVGLADVARRPLGRYSRGMLRRFALAQAFLHEPELVLLDEPTAGLDAPGYAVLEELLGEARARGAAVLLASHVWTDLRAYTDRVHVLLDGRIARAGAPDELLQEGRGLAELYAR